MNEFSIPKEIKEGRVLDIFSFNEFVESNSCEKKYFLKKPAPTVCRCGFLENSGRRTI